MSDYIQAELGGSVHFLPTVDPLPVYPHQPFFASVFICPECGVHWGSRTPLFISNPDVPIRFSAFNRPCYECGDGSLFHHADFDLIDFSATAQAELELFTDDCFRLSRLRFF